MDLLSLRKELKTFRSELSADEMKLQMLNNQHQKNQTNIDKCSSDIYMLERVAILLQKTAERQRAYVCNQIELIGTSALQYVYGTNYALKLEMNSGKKKAECELWVIETMPNGTQVKLKPQDSKGGGVTDIVSLALRFAILQVYNTPEIDGPTILDEPGKHVSKEFSSLLSDFLINLSEQLGRQQIVVTHNEFMAESAPNAIKVRRENGISVVERCQ